MSKSPNTYQRIYDIVRQIPYGRVTSYGAIARCIGLERSARLVGWAMKSSHGLNIPAHRVVNRLGVLSGKHHFPGTNLMQELLESEGLKIESDQIVDFKDFFWNPMDHLNLDEQGEQH